MSGKPESSFAQEKLRGFKPRAAAALDSMNESPEDVQAAQLQSAEVLEGLGLGHLARQAAQGVPVPGFLQPAGLRVAGGGPGGAPAPGAEAQAPGAAGPQAATPQPATPQAAVPQAGAPGAGPQAAVPQAAPQGPQAVGPQAAGPQGPQATPEGDAPTPGAAPQEESETPEGETEAQTPEGETEAQSPEGGAPGAGAQSLDPAAAPGLDPAAAPGPQAAPQGAVPDAAGPGAAGPGAAGPGPVPQAPAPEFAPAPQGGGAAPAPAAVGAPPQPMPVTYGAGPVRPSQALLALAGKTPTGYLEEAFKAGPAGAQFQAGRTTNKQFIEAVSQLQKFSAEPHQHLGSDPFKVEPYQLSGWNWESVQAVLQKVGNFAGKAADIIGTVATLTKVAGWVLTVLAPPVGAALTTIGNAATLIEIILNAVSAVCSGLNAIIDICRLCTTNNPQERMKLAARFADNVLGGLGRGLMALGGAKSGGVKEGKEAFSQIRRAGSAAMKGGLRSGGQAAMRGLRNGARTAMAGARAGGATMGRGASRAARGMAAGTGTAVRGAGRGAGLAAQGARAGSRTAATGLAQGGRTAMRGVGTAATGLKRAAGQVITATRQGGLRAGMSAMRGASNVAGRGLRAGMASIRQGAGIGMRGLGAGARQFANGMRVGARTAMAGLRAGGRTAMQGIRSGLRTMRGGLRQMGNGMRAGGRQAGRGLGAGGRLGMRGARTGAHGLVPKAGSIADDLAAMQGRGVGGRLRYMALEKPFKAGSERLLKPSAEQASKMGRLQRLRFAAERATIGRLPHSHKVMGALYVFQDHIKRAKDIRGLYKKFSGNSHPPGQWIDDASDRASKFGLGDKRASNGQKGSGDKTKTQGKNVLKFREQGGHTRMLNEAYRRATQQGREDQIGNMRNATTALQNAGRGGQSRGGGAPTPPAPATGGGGRSPAAPRSSGGGGGGGGMSMAPPSGRNRTETLANITRQMAIYEQQLQQLQAEQQAYSTAQAQADQLSGLPMPDGNVGGAPSAIAELDEDIAGLTQAEQNANQAKAAFQANMEAQTQRGQDAEALLTQARAQRAAMTQDQQAGQQEQQKIDQGAQGMTRAEQQNTQMGNKGAEGKSKGEEAANKANSTRPEAKPEPPQEDVPWYRLDKHAVNLVKSAWQATVGRAMAYIGEKFAALKQKLMEMLMEFALGLAGGDELKQQFREANQKSRQNTADNQQATQKNTQTGQALAQHEQTGEAGKADANEAAAGYAALVVEAEEAAAAARTRVAEVQAEKASMAAEVQAFEGSYGDTFKQANQAASQTWGQRDPSPTIEAIQSAMGDLQSEQARLESEPEEAAEPETPAPAAPTPEPVAPAPDERTQADERGPEEAQPDVSGDTPAANESAPEATQQSEAPSAQDRARLDALDAAMALARQSLNEARMRAQANGDASQFERNVAAVASAIAQSESMLARAHAGDQAALGALDDLAETLAESCEVIGELVEQLGQGAGPGATPGGDAPADEQTENETEASP